jgi:His/Glu/Gln/Arg/opine family amino acid ABC transporter permease subunit
MFDVIISTMPFLLEGLWMTFKISLITIFFGSLIGVVVGMLRTLDYAVITYPLGAYVHVLRGTPFLIHLYFVYFMLPATGISWLQLEAFPAAVIALSLYTSTYVAEIVRGAIQAVPLHRLGDRHRRVGPGRRTRHPAPPQGADGDLRADRADVFRLLLPGLADRPLGRDQIRQRPLAVVTPHSKDPWV